VLGQARLQPSPLDICSDNRAPPGTERFTGRLVSCPLGQVLETVIADLPLRDVNADGMVSPRRRGN
jgi:hypothetical protein